MHSLFQRTAAFLTAASLLLTPLSAYALTTSDGIPEETPLVFELDLKQKNALQDFIIKNLSDDLSEEILPEYPAEASEAMNPEEKTSTNDENQKKEREEREKLAELFAQMMQNDTIKIGMNLPEKLENGEYTEDPTIFVASKITPEQWKELSLYIEKKLTKETYKNENFYKKDSANLFLIQKENLLIVTSTEKGMQKTIDALTSGKTLTVNTTYQEAAKYFLKDQLIGMFAESKSLKTLFENWSEELDSIKKIFDSGKSIAFSAAKRSDGIEIQTADIYDTAKREALGITTKDLIYTPSLYKKSPVEKPVIYYEGFNMKKAWEVNKKIESGLSMEAIEEGRKEISENFGIDFEKDLIDLLDKEFFIAVGEQDQVFPSMNFFADVSSDTEAAQKTIETIVKKFEKTLDEDKDVEYEMNEGEIASGKSYTFLIDAPERLKKQDKELSLIAPITLHLGVTIDKVLYISTDKNLSENYAKGVQEEALSKLTGDKIQSRFYFGIKNAFNYYKKIMTKVHKKIEKDGQKYFDPEDLFTKMDAVAAPWSDMTLISTAEPGLNKGSFYIHVNIDALDAAYLGAMEAFSKAVDETENRYYRYTEKNFNDVPGKAWYSQDVKDAHVYGIANGYYEDNTFRPDREITRAEFLTMVMRATGKESGYAYGLRTEETADLPSDLHPEDWYFSYIQQALEEEIISGYEDNTIRPNNPITRAEAAKIIANIIGDNESKGKDFTDVPEEAWFKNAVDTNRGMGIMEGNPDGTFAPYRTLNRAEAVAIINRLREVLGKRKGGENVGFNVESKVSGSKAGWPGKLKKVLGSTNLF